MARYAPEPQSEPLVPPPQRVSLWVRVRPFVAAFILVSVSFIGLHIWDQIGTLNEGSASSAQPARPVALERRPTSAAPTPASLALRATAPRATATPPPAPPTPLPTVAIFPTGGITPIIPEVVQITTQDLVITILEPTLAPTATAEPTARPPVRPRVPTVPAAPVLPRPPAVAPVVPTARPVVTRPPVVVPPPPPPTALPPAWRAPVQTPGNWTRPKPATPVP